MELLALPAFADNYIWMLHDGREALVVDPGQAMPVIRALQAHRLKLTGILVTHHHGDHVGGLAELQHHLHGSVHAPATEDIPGPHTAVSGGGAVHWNGLDFDVIDVPGHTRGHIAYYCPDLRGEPVLFCGDTLFSGGCGRLFEGTPAQMLQSVSRLGELPGRTRVCCAHEYTLGNLKFALAVEPGNPDLMRYHAQCESLRARDLPTLPSSIAQELLINPFLRCSQPQVVAAARAQGAASDDPVDVFAAIRQWKNEFR